MKKVTLFGVSLWFANETCSLWSQEYIEKTGSYELEKGNHDTRDAFDFKRRIPKAEAHLTPISAFQEKRKQILKEIKVLEEQIGKLMRKKHCLDRAEADYATGALRVIKAEDYASK